MKILILEDSSSRIQKFAEWLYGKDYSVVSKVDDGLAMLKQTDFDYVFLDFELGFDEPTGSALTRQWKRQKDALSTTKPIVVVHTSSDSGASLMMTDLRIMGLETVRMPFYNMSKAFLDKLFSR